MNYELDLNSGLREVVIDGKRVADDTDCYVIAEIGNNHQGSLETCKEMFKLAKECGADAVKLQKRDNDTLFTEEFFNKPYNSENAFAPTYGEHRRVLELGKEAYIELQRYAKEIGITFFSTAFDISSAHILKSLDMPCYKIASADLTHIPLLKLVAGFGKPIIISTGGAKQEDVDRAVQAILPINQNLVVMQCTASYPAKFEDLDLNVISTYRNKYPNTVIGLSSHDNGIAMAVAAFVLGARVVEKHFTVNRAMKGTDHAFSLEPQGLRKMTRDLKRTHQALGSFEKRPHSSEIEPLKKMRKKMVTSRPLKEGHVLTSEDIEFKCPGDGLAPYYFEKIIGQRLKLDVPKEFSLSFEHLNPLHD